MNEEQLKKLETKIAEKLDHMTTDTHMVPFWVEAIMHLVKEWAESEMKKDKV